MVPPTAHTSSAAGAETLDMNTREFFAGWMVAATWQPPTSVAFLP
jgi:hypothetical protein